MVKLKDFDILILNEFGKEKLGIDFVLCWDDHYVYTSPTKDGCLYLGENYDQEEMEKWVEEVRRPNSPYLLLNTIMGKYRDEYTVVWGSGTERFKDLPQEIGKFKVQYHSDGTGIHVDGEFICTADLKKMIKAIEGG